MTIPSLEFRLPFGLKFEDSALENPPVLADGSNQDIVIGRTGEGVQGAATFLGKVAEPGQFDKKLWLDLQGAHAVYVMGKRRGGKSHTLGAICEGLASDSWITALGERQGLLVFDTMNIFLTMPRKKEASEEDSGDADWSLPSELPSVQLLRPGGTPSIAGFEIPELHLGGHDLTSEEWIQTFGVDQYADVLGHLIFDAYERVRATGFNAPSGFVAPKPRFGVQDLETCIAQAAELNGFRDETRQAAMRRFRALSQNSIFDAIGLDLPALLRPGVVSVLLLRDLPPETRELFVAVLVRRIMEARSITEHYERLLRVRTSADAENVELWKEEVRKGTPRAWLVLDEAHNYIPAGRSAISKRPLKRLIDEGRNLGLSVMVATQQPSGLDGSIQRNADILLIHAMTMDDDIKAAAGMLNALWPRKVSIARGGNLRACDFPEAVRALPRGYALVSCDVMPRVFAAKIRPRLTEPGGRGY